MSEAQYLMSEQYHQIIQTQNWNGQPFQIPADIIYNPPAKGMFKTERAGKIDVTAAGYSMPENPAWTPQYK